MYFDLNVSVPQLPTAQGNRKGKAKQDETFTPSQLEDIETRVDLLVHCALWISISSNQSD